MPDDPSPAPNFAKAGLGALGDVNNVHDASQHSHHEDNSQHSHVHYHVVPPTTPPVSDGSSGGVRQWNINIVLKIVFGVGGLGLLAWFLKQAQQQSSVMMPPIMTAPATVMEVLQVRLNRPSYQVDELMEITVSSQHAGYLYVLAVWGDGRVDTLFPNSLRPDARIPAGTSLHLPKDFPPAANGLVLRYPMAMPALPGNPARATESILAVLSPAPLDLPHSTELTSMPGFGAVGMLDDPGFRTRGPHPKFMKLQKAPTLEFGSLPQAAIHYDVYR